MSCIDGFVISVPTANQEAYRKHAGKVAALFREHFATAVVECCRDDMAGGKVTSFRSIGSVHNPS